MTAVHIIESPSPRDISDGKTEGRALCEYFRLSNTPHSYSMTVNVEQFLRSIDLSDENNEIRKNIVQRHPPIIHLSIHGDGNGIQLTDGTVLSWDDLRILFTTMNEILPDGLMLAFSTCGGASSIRMSMLEDEKSKPFYATVGSFEAISWNDALVAFTVFYHNWFKNMPLEYCANAMRIASGHNGFSSYSGLEQKQFYINYVQNQRIIEALTRVSPPHTPGPQTTADWLGSILIPPDDTPDED